MPSRRRMLGRLGAAAVVPTVATLARPALTAGSTPVEWHRTYGDADYQCHGLVDVDGSVVLVGRTGSGRSDDPWLADVGPDGDPRWTTTVDTPGFTRAVDAVPIENGYSVLLTVDARPSLVLVRVDDDGREQWRTRAEGPHPDGIRVLRRTDDGYVVGGFRGNPRRIDADLDAWLRAIDDDGGTRWERTYDGSTVADVRPWDGGFLLAGSDGGDAWLQAVGSDGAPRWSHTYGGIGTESAAVAVPERGGILYGGRTGSNPADHRRAMLVRTTADGEFVWRRTQDPQHVSDLVPYGDGFAFTGEPRNRDTRGRNREKPIYAVDRWGRVGDRVTVTVDPGAPVGLARFDDGIAVGGWDGDDGVWLAKVHLDR